MEMQTRTQNAEDIHTAFRVEEIDIEELRQKVPEVDRVLAAMDLEPDPLEVRYGRPLPVQLIARYAKLAALRADTERLESGAWYAEIRGFSGVWAEGASEEEAVKELESVVRDWTLLKIMDEDRDLPVVDLIDLNVL